MRQSLGFVRRFHVAIRKKEDISHELQKKIVGINEILFGEKVYAQEESKKMFVQMLPLTENLIKINDELSHYDDPSDTASLRDKSGRISMRLNFAQCGGEIIKIYVDMYRFVAMEQFFLVKRLNPTLVGIIKNEKYHEEWNTHLKKYENFLKVLEVSVDKGYLLIEELENKGFLSYLKEPSSEKVQGNRTKVIDNIIQSIRHKIGSNESDKGEKTTVAEKEARYWLKYSYNEGWIVKEEETTLIRHIILVFFDPSPILIEPQRLAALGRDIESSTLFDKKKHADQIHFFTSEIERIIQDRKLKRTQLANKFVTDAKAKKIGDLKSLVNLKEPILLPKEKDYLDELIVHLDFAFVNFETKDLDLDISKEECVGIFGTSRQASLKAISEGVHREKEDLRKKVKSVYIGAIKVRQFPKIAPLFEIKTRKERDKFSPVLFTSQESSFLVELKNACVVAVASYNLRPFEHEVKKSIFIAIFDEEEQRFFGEFSGQLNEEISSIRSKTKDGFITNIEKKSFEENPRLLQGREVVLVFDSGEVGLFRDINDLAKIANDQYYTADLMARCKEPAAVALFSEVEESMRLHEYVMEIEERKRNEIKRIKTVYIEHIESKNFGQIKGLLDQNIVSLVFQRPHILFLEDLGITIKVDTERYQTAHIRVEFNEKTFSEVFDKDEKMRLSEYADQIDAEREREISEIKTRYFRNLGDRNIVNGLRQIAALLAEPRTKILLHKNIPFFEELTNSVTNIAKAPRRPLELLESSEAGQVLIKREIDSLKSFVEKRKTALEDAAIDNHLEHTAAQIRRAQEVDLDRRDETERNRKSGIKKDLGRD